MAESTRERAREQQDDDFFPSDRGEPRGRGVHRRVEHAQPAPKGSARKKPAQKSAAKKPAAKKSAPTTRKKPAATKPATKKPAAAKATQTTQKKTAQKGGPRRPDPGDTELSRRSVLLGGGVLAAGTGFILAGALDLLPVGKPEPPARRVPEAPKTWVIGTADWNARPAQRKARVLTSAPRYLIVHHTSTPNVTDYSVSRAERLAQGIQKSHMQRGWGDTGQHFTISRGGYILEGRHGSLAAARKGDMVVGTHVRGANEFTVGIECEGTYNTVLPPQALVDSLVRLLAWLCIQYDLNPRKAIVPHRKFNQTDCCGDKFAPTLPKLREEVARAVPAKLLT